MRKTSKLLLAFSFVFLLFPAASFAYEAKAGNTVFVDKDKTIDGNLYAAAQSITVDGNVKGDLICAGQTVLINGSIDGDILCAAQTIVINGSTTGDVRLAAETVSLNGKVAGNANFFGMSFSMGPDALIGKDLFLAGAISNINGKITNNLHGGVATLNLNGEVGKDVKLRMGEAQNIKNIDGKEGEAALTLTDKAVIGGNLYYVAPQQAKIAEGAIVKGETSFSEPKTKNKQNKNDDFFWSYIYHIFAALVIGLVLISIFKKPTLELLGRMLTDKSGSLGRGIILMFITPFIILVLLLTLIGIPLALLVLMLWLIAMYIAKILFGIFIGQEIMKSFKKPEIGIKIQQPLIYSMIIGVILVETLSSIDLLGFIISLIAIWWGLGGIWLYFKDHYQKA